MNKFLTILIGFSIALFISYGILQLIAYMWKKSGEDPRDLKESCSIILFVAIVTVIVTLVCVIINSPNAVDYRIILSDVFRSYW